MVELCYNQEKLPAGGLVMAFFDDIGKKITQVSQNTVQKTKDVVDVSRLNSSISDEQKKINSLCQELGKKYVALRSQAPEEEFAAFVTAVKECEEKIAEYKQQIKEIKRVSICEKCGGEIPYGNTFCGNCGTPVAPIVDPDKVLCARCGAMVDKTMRFCTTCGNVMPAAETMPAPVAEPAPAPAPAPIAEPAPAPVVDGPRCANCSAVLETDMAFCVFCGTPVAPVAAPAAPAVEPTVEPVAVVTEPEPAVEPAGPCCANCGTPLALDAAFCTECGTPVTAPAAPAVVCPNCGTALLDNAAFCTECGTKL